MIKSDFPLPAEPNSICFWELLRSHFWGGMGIKHTLSTTISQLYSTVFSSAWPLWQAACAPVFCLTLSSEGTPAFYYCL